MKENENSNENEMNNDIMKWIMDNESNERIILIEMK